MDDIAVKIDHLSKRYRIGLREVQSESLVGRLSDLAVFPIRNFRRLRKLSKFGEKHDSKDVVWALDDISFEVKQGEVVGIIGNNGAGKSTLLKVLSRITDPTKGEVTVNGRTGSLLEVGTGFHPELTGRENIYLNGTILGMSRKEVARKFDEIVDYSGVDRFLDTPIKRYSTGMKVRLAFAVAANLEPEILMIDEVLAVGDVGFQRKCLGKMTEIAASGRTVLFVSHNIGAISSLCPRTIWIEDGRVKVDGPSSEVISSYLLSEGGTDSVWTNPTPPNDAADIHFRGVRLLDNNNQPISLIRFDQSLQIEIGYDVENAPGIQHIVCQISDLQGNFIFETDDTDTNGWDSRRRARGYHTSTCQVPASLLKPGGYLVSVQSYIRGTRLVGHSNILSFEISNQGYSFRPRQGFVTPLLDWQTTTKNSTPFGN